MATIPVIVGRAIIVAGSSPPLVSAPAGAASPQGSAPLWVPPRSVGWLPGCAGVASGWLGLAGLAWLGFVGFGLIAPFASASTRKSLVRDPRAS